MLVIKRDDSSVDFDIKKIESAIDKAFVAVDRKPLEFVTQRLALLAISKLDSKAEEWKIEDIQDSVEYALVEAGFSDVAKAYILYRQSRSDRRAGKTVIDYKKIIENYVDAVDWRVKENSTVNYSIGGLILNASGAVTANYWLSEVYDKEIGEAHKNGDMHIHDLSMLAPYCFTGDTVVRSLDGKNRTFEQLVKDGVKGLWVYAYDHKNNCIVPAKAINPRVTRKTNRLVHVKFSGNVEFTCTPDHPIMLRNGKFIKAGDLKTNMSVMPLYVSEKSKYCRISKYWVSDKKQQYLHRWVLENKLGRALLDNEVSHHINGDKHDNRPENLEVMTDRDHRTMEVLKTMETENWKRNNRARLVSYNKSAEKRNQVSAFANSRPRTAAGTFAYIGPVAGPAYNHRVMSVKPVVLEKEVEVYDLTVPGYENFAVAGGVFVHNCAGWSLKQLIREGLGGVPGKIASAPAQHLSTLCNQMVNFLGIMQNEWAGAQAFSSFDTYLAAFVKKDNLTYKQVKQCIQSFIYGVNTPSRWGTQAPFSNITLDWNIPEDLKNVPAIVGGKDMDFTYGDCQKEADMVNKAFIEVMTEGDANGRGFQYPIPTYSITKDFDWSETENNKALFEMAAKYGTPYFSNYVNSDMEPSDIRSMCCRLRLDLRDLRRKNGGFFGSGDSTGSVGVVTINMPRIGYLSTSREDFFEKLDKMMDIAARSLKLKRNKINELLEKGLYPYTKRYLGSLSNHFSTIGLVGMNEACMNAKWLSKDMTDSESQKFAEEVLDHMRERLSDYQEMYPGDLYNLEATPAESTAFRLAKHDRKHYPDIITSGTEESPYYTNSTNLPVGYTDDIWKALDVQDRLQIKYTSGTVFHTFLGQRISDWRGAMNLIRAICSNYRLPYISLSPTYSVCQEHGYLEGEQAICPHCGKTTEIYSRITGYYRAVQNWNPGKTQEYKERKEYTEQSQKPVKNIIIDGNISSLAETSSENGDSETHENKDCGCEIQHDPKQVVEQAEERFSRPMLFTTPTCPNCPTAKAHLGRKNIKYDVIDATQAIELVERYGIQSVPTLVADNEVYRGLGAVMGWINKH